jgi:hypothetical protein
MLTGNPNAKAPVTPPYTTYQCQKTFTDIYVSIERIKHMSYYLKGYLPLFRQYGPDFNFETACDTGIKTELKFPSWYVQALLQISLRRLL